MRQCDEFTGVPVWLSGRKRGGGTIAVPLGVSAHALSSAPRSFSGRPREGGDPYSLDHRVVGSGTTLSFVIITLSGYGPRFRGDDIGSVARSRAPSSPDSVFKQLALADVRHRPCCCDGVARGACPVRAKYNPRHQRSRAIAPIIWKARGRPNSFHRFALNEGARNAGCASASAAPCAKVKSTRA